LISLDQVTIISLAGFNYESAIDAICTSQEGIRFADAKILTPTKPSHVPSNVKWEQTKPLRRRDHGIDDYSHYFLYDIWKHVETPFCLVVQGDGYVINPKQWTDDFLNYDYIGAPWPALKTAYVDPFGHSQRVGNGGFSLRSKKLLTVPQNIEIPWDVNEGSFYNHFGAGSLAEDGNISVHNKHLFEQEGCRYAPVEVAVHFSQELPVPEARGITPFGFHKYMPKKSALRKLRHLRGWLT
jgi:hypothetical protein